MVLICDNNVLSIETFHKHRCEEKNDIRNIINNRKYNRYEEKEPEPEKVPTRSFAAFMATVGAGNDRRTSTNTIVLNRR